MVSMGRSRNCCKLSAQRRQTRFSAATAADGGWSGKANEQPAEKKCRAAGKATGDRSSIAGMGCNAGQSVLPLCLQHCIATGSSVSSSPYAVQQGIRSLVATP